MKFYGLPYQGSKNFIATRIARDLPPAENYYDLFCGGGAVLQAVSEIKKYKNYYTNELNPVVYDGLVKAFSGYYKTENRWISREDFWKLKDTDFYVYSCFSFGNKGTSYCYGTHIEPWKKAVHYARVFNDFSLLKEFGIITTDISKSNIKKHLAEYKSKYIKWFCDTKNLSYDNLDRNKSIIMNQFTTEKERNKKDLIKLEKTEDFYLLENQQTLKRLINFRDQTNLRSSEILLRQNNLQRLHRLQKIQLLNNIAFYNKDYREIEIKDNSVVYCDPPYVGTEPYHIKNEEIKFNHEEFYRYIKELSKNKTIKIFISEYFMPSEDFIKIREYPKISSMVRNEYDFGIKTDNLYIPKSQKYEDPLEEDMFPMFRSNYAESDFNW